MKIVKVVFAIPLMRAFDYQLPMNMDFPPKGSRVLVPFGKRTALGIVLAHSHHSKITDEQLKTIHKVLDQKSLFNHHLWSLLLWASKYYHHPIGQVLFHALPVLLRQGKSAVFAQRWQWQITEQGQNVAFNKLKISPKQQQALALLRQHPQITANQLSKNTLQALKKKP